MSYRSAIRLVASSLLIWSARAFAQGVNYKPQIVHVDTGVQTTILAIIAGLIKLMAVWAPLLATALFVIGAYYMVASGGNDNTVSKGKSIMKGAAIGLAIVLGSWLILSFAVYFIAGG